MQLLMTIIWQARDVSCQNDEKHRAGVRERVRNNVNFLFLKGMVTMVMRTMVVMMSKDE